MGLGGRLVAAWLAALLLVGLAAAPASADGGLRGAVTDAVLDEAEPLTPGDREAETEPGPDLSASNDSEGRDARSDESGTGGVSNAVDRLSESVGDAVEAAASTDGRESQDGTTEERTSPERVAEPARSEGTTRTAVTELAPEHDELTEAARHALDRDGSSEDAVPTRSESARNEYASTPVVGSVVEVAEPVVAAAAEPVREAVEPISASAQPLAVVAEPMSTAALEPLAEVIEPADRSTVEPVTEVVEPVSRTLDSTVAPLESTTRAVEPALTSVVEPLTEVAEPVVATAVESVAATIEPVVVSAAQPLSDAVEPVSTVALEPLAGTIQPVVDTSRLTVGQVGEALTSTSSPLTEAVAPLVAPITEGGPTPIAPVAPAPTDIVLRAESVDTTSGGRPASGPELVDEALFSPMPTGFDSGPLVVTPDAPAPVVSSATGVDRRPSGENARGAPTAEGVPATAGWAPSIHGVRHGVPTTSVSSPDSMGHVVSSSGLLRTGGGSGGVTFAALASFLLLATAFSVARRVCLDTRAPAAWSFAPIPPPG